MAGSGKCEACETINSGDINRDSGKGAFLPTILGSRDERLEKFGICSLGGKLPPPKIIPNPVVYDFAPTFVTEIMGIFGP